MRSLTLSLTVIVPPDGFVERRQLWRGKTLCVLVPEILDLYSHYQNGAQAAAALWCLPRCLLHTIYFAIPVSSATMTLEGFLSLSRRSP